MHHYDAFTSETHISDLQQREDEVKAESCAPTGSSQTDHNDTIKVDDVNLDQTGDHHENIVDSQNECILDDDAFTSSGSSLQDAFLQKRKDFIEKSKVRALKVKQARDAKKTVKFALSGRLDQPGKSTSDTKRTTSSESESVISDVGVMKLDRGKFAIVSAESYAIT